MRSQCSAVLMIVLSVVCPSSIVFGQGVQLTPPNVYQSIPTRGERAVAPDPQDRDSPSSVALSMAPGIDPRWGTDVAIDLPPRFDLTDYLPTPGKQIQNDCVAWAIAHAAYTCQTAQERRQRPLDDCDQFSPPFIYEQLSENGNALQVSQAIDFVKQNGCATRATMPISQTRVSRHAVIEAKTYLTRRNERAATLSQIKTYIYEGYPVVLVVRMGGDLRSDLASDSPYLWRDERDPKDDYHAFTAIGFDDSQSALLVMNSWGVQWKDAGFCWVSYDNFDRMDDQGWCAEAHVVAVKRFAPYNVSMAAPASQRTPLAAPQRFQRRTFRLAADRKVYEFNRVISPDQWVFDDVACNRHSLFALGRDQTIYRMNDEPTGYSWTHCDSGAVSSKKITMMAGDRSSDMWVLTKDHQLFQYDDARGDWNAVTLSATGSGPIDVRVVAGQIHATTSNGAVFVHQPAGDWLISH